MLLEQYITPENIIIVVILLVLCYLAYKKYQKNNNSYEHAGNIMVSSEYVPAILIDDTLSVSNIELNSALASIMKKSNSTIDITTVGRKDLRDLNNLKKDNIIVTYGENYWNKVKGEKIIFPVNYFYYNIKNVNLLYNKGKNFLYLGYDEDPLILYEISHHTKDKDKREELKKIDGKTTKWNKTTINFSTAFIYIDNKYFIQRKYFVNVYKNKNKFTVIKQEDITTEINNLLSVLNNNSKNIKFEIYFNPNSPGYLAFKINDITKVKDIEKTKDTFNIITESFVSDCNKCPK